MKPHACTSMPTAVDRGHSLRVHARHIAPQSLIVSASVANFRATRRHERRRYSQDCGGVPAVHGKAGVEV